MRAAYSQTLGRYRCLERTAGKRSSRGPDLNYGLTMPFRYLTFLPAAFRVLFSQGYPKIKIRSENKSMAFLHEVP